jgi:hypothetical protein
MQHKKNISPKWLFTILLLALTSVSFAWVYYAPTLKNLLVSYSSQKNTLKIDEKAQKLLMEMSNALKNLKEFKFQSKGYFEVVDSMGRKEKMHNSGELFIKRPDKLKVSRTGAKSDLDFYCDGETVTLYGKGKNLYATAVAESNLDKTFDNLRENLNIELPATDLLYTDVYEGLMQDVTDGKYIGREKVGNVACHRLSFTGKDVDWEIWIEESEKRLPRKYIIKSKTLEETPEAKIEITEWTTDIKLKDNLFTFTPPKGAQKIEFLPLNPDTQTKK